MKIIFSRKGFDSAAGRVPSPILQGKPISIPIPATKNSTTRYADLGLGDIVTKISKRRMSGNNLCHHDPMFFEGQCFFGQTGAAQSHLARNNVSAGDLFLFFGLFADEHNGERHHRFFGYLRVEAVHPVAKLPSALRADLEALRHPHVIGNWTKHDAIYIGEGLAAAQALPELRLTRPGGPLSQWQVPDWIAGKGLTYHGKPWRWSTARELTAVSRGQEFVSDVGDDPEAHAWAERIVSLIRS